MASLRRPTYTKPIPADAELITHNGVASARFKDAKGKSIIAPLTAKGDKIVLRNRKWYGYYVDASGRPRTVPLSTNKTAAEQMLADLVRKVELHKAGVRDPFEQHRTRSLREHVDDWAQSLLDANASAKHVRQTVACVRRIIDGCGFTSADDMSASKVQGFVAKLRRPRHRPTALPDSLQSATRNQLAELLDVKPSAIPFLVKHHRLQAHGYGKSRRYPRSTVQALLEARQKGCSIKTANLYVDAIKQFAAWLVDDKRTPDNPLVHLVGDNVQLDRRHDRRALTVDELRAVMIAASNSDVRILDLAGDDRAMIYAVACSSGFRASEIASLCPAAFALDGEYPTVTLSAIAAKNGKTAVQPLPADLASALSSYLAGRPEDLPVWPGAWTKRAAQMFRVDLDAAGIPYVVDGPNGPLYADFHALRHSFIAALDATGATLKEAMQLARHSDPKLTMAVYGRKQLHDLDAAVQRLPSMLGSTPPEKNVLRATGTDGQLSTSQVASIQPAFKAADDTCGRMQTGDEATAEDHSTATLRNSLTVRTIADDCGDMRTDEESSPSRTRTYNKPVNSRLLADHNSNLINENSQVKGQHAAQHSNDSDGVSDLSVIADAWPRLPAHVRTAILALVKGG